MSLTHIWIYFCFCFRATFPWHASHIKGKEMVTTRFLFLWNKTIVFFHWNVSVTLTTHEMYGFVSSMCLFLCFLFSWHVSVTRTTDKGNEIAPTFVSLIVLFCCFFRDTFPPHAWHAPWHAPWGWRGKQSHILSVTLLFSSPYFKTIQCLHRIHHHICFQVFTSNAFRCHPTSFGFWILEFSEGVRFAVGWHVFWNPGLKHAFMEFKAAFQKSI